MKAYILRRLALLVPVLLGVSFLSFSLIRLIPGDPAAQILSRAGNPTEEDFARVRKQLHIDKPIPQQFVSWLGGIAHGDFGTSFRHNQQVRDLLADRWQISFELAFMSVFFSTTLGLLLGIISATRQDSVIDYGGRIFAIIGLSMPNFVLATMLLLFLAVKFNWIPSVGYAKIQDDPWTNFQQFIFPSLILGFGLAASIARMTRSTMLEVLRQDYIRTAWAKGLRERNVILRHALRNAMIPVITIIGLQFGILLGGEAIMEIIFNMPGIGFSMVNSIIQRDYPLMQMLVLFTSVVYVLVNLLVDLSYGLLDPRVRYS